jgi:hypothetical protein
MYYILRGARTGNAKDFLLAAILFAPTFAAGGTGRMATLSLLASLGFFLYRWLPVGRFWSIAAKFSLIAALGIGLAYAVAPAFITQRVAAYSDAFRVTLTGTEVSDVSANVRLLQVLTALPYIQKHPLLGNGVLSAQWYGGEQSLLGDLFNSSDIGLVGGVFIFGGLGLIALAYQFRFAARAARRLSPSIRSPLADATKAFLLYVAISSFSACYFAFNPEKTLFFITLLVGISLQAREQGDDFKEMGLCNPQEPALSV